MGSSFGSGSMQPSSYLCVHCIYGGHQALQSSKNPATSCHICVQCVNSVQHLSGGPTDRLGQLALCPLCGHDSCSQGHSPKGPNAAGCTQVLATTKNVHFTATGDISPLHPVTHPKSKQAQPSRALVTVYQIHLKVSRGWSKTYPGHPS